MGRIEPLAYRMQPKTLDDVLGQEHLIGKDKPLTNMLNSKFIPSMILHGTSGIGKTSIVNALANDMNLTLEKFNASTDNKKRLQEIITKAKDSEDSIILFIDEIHRLLAQNMDYLLPFIN